MAHGGHCIRKSFTADTTLAVGTVGEIPTNAAYVYVHWILVTPDGTNSCLVEIEQPAATVIASVRTTTVQSSFVRFEPALRLSAAAVTLDVTLGAGTMQGIIGYTTT